MDAKYISGFTSVNSRVIVEPYKKTEMKSEVKNGFALIGQKNHLKGLRVLADFNAPDGTVIKAGYKVFVKEETLHTAPWATKVLECEGIEGPFMVMDFHHVELVSL